MISDIATNIVRRDLVDYTQAQCELYGIPTTQVPFGPFWNPANLRWSNDYTRLPVIGARPILLVPKAFVRWSTTFSPQTYYNKFVLEFLQAENLDQQTALVETLRSGRQRVTKKALKEVFPLSKDFLSTFTEHHPGVLAEYRASLGIPVEIGDDDLVEGFDETVFANVLIEALRRIPVGAAQATTYHRFAMGLLEFIFYPGLIYPQLEQEIHEGRKRMTFSTITQRARASSSHKEPIPM